MSDSQKGAEGFTAHDEEAEVEGHGFNGAEGAEGFLGAEGYEATSDGDDVEAHLFERPEGFEGYENAK
jgi:hypothetical protein